MFVNYMNITVNDDDEAYRTRDFKSLREYGMCMLNERLSNMSGTGRRVVPMNVIEDWDCYEVQPVMCNSSTWYKRHSLKLTLWYSLEVKPDVPEVRTK